ncbi:MAG: hypothetical protein WDO13_19470 [Verrucomicrobiota bacterium]
MSRAATTGRAGKSLALALTWDGARWPAARLPAPARTFLRRAAPAPAADRVARLLAEGKIRELVICWVPRLKGGEPTLADVFTTSDGRRVAFQAVRTVRIGDILGVRYRRLK